MMLEAVRLEMVEAQHSSDQVVSLVQVSRLLHLFLPGHDMQELLHCLAYLAHSCVLVITALQELKKTLISEQNPSTLEVELLGQLQQVTKVKNLCILEQRPANNGCCWPCKITSHQCFSTSDTKPAPLSPMPTP